MRQTKQQQQREAERADAFHKRVTLAILGGFAVVIVTATIVAMWVS